MNYHDLNFKNNIEIHLKDLISEPWVEVLDMFIT